MRISTGGKVKIYILIAGVMIALMLTACTDKEVAIQKQELTNVKAEVVIESEFTPELEFSGTVSPFREANLGTALPGRVEKVYFQEGDIVQQGDLIVELSDELLQQAEIEYKTYEKDYNRMLRLKEKGSVPEMDFDHIKAQYEAKLENYQMIRKNTRIIAPFRGTIIKFLVQEGENYLFNINLEPGYSTTSGIVRLMAIDKVKVEFEVGSADLANIKPGLVAEVFPASYPDQAFTGKISSCKPYLNQITRSMGAVIELDNQKGILKPGMYAEVKIKLPSKIGILVPLQSVQRIAGTGEDIVYVIQNSIIQKRSVQRIFTSSERVAVSGLKPGEQIVISGKGKIKSGQQVNVISEED